MNEKDGLLFALIRIEDNLDKINGKVDKIDEKVGDLREDGAARAQAHVDLSRRVSILESPRSGEGDSGDLKNLKKELLRKKIWILGLVGSLVIALTAAVGTYAYTANGAPPEAKEIDVDRADP